jgi:hypothetical protein
MSIEIVCFGCGDRGHLDEVAPLVKHACGSTNVDVWFGTPDQQRKVAVAVARQGGPSFADFMREGAKEPGMPPPTDGDKKWPGYVGDDPEAGWDEYAGPGPGANPTNAPVHTDLTPRAPTRPVPGQVGETNLYVYDKHNPAPGYGADAPAPLVAPHNYPNHSTTTPFLARKKTEVEPEGVLLKQASCPVCYAPDTSLRADQREHAHWFCHEKCGSLADVDKHPEVDPYRPPLRTEWGRDSFSQGRRVFAGKKNGQVFPRMATISRMNPGLSLPETFHLARRSVLHYPEA